MKRIFALALCVLLVCMAGTAMAAASGSCGSNLTWTLDDDGTLTISGTGAMKDYAFGDNGVWRYSKKVVVESGVTTVGDHAFNRCNKLTEVILPDGLVSLGECAFTNCTALETISLPGSISAIGKSAFQNCKELTEIEIPEGVTTIADATFDGCFALKRVSLPASLTQMDAVKVFDRCKALEEIEVVPGGAYFKTEDGVLYTGDGTTLLYYPMGKKAESFTTPADVTAIGDGAFMVNGNIKRVTLTQGVTCIGSKAFWWCTNITDVTIPASVTSIGDEAFYLCNKLKQITIPAGVTSIGEDAFVGCGALTIADVPCSWNETPLYDFGEGVEVVIHKWSYTAAGATITESCDKGCGKGGRVTLIAPEPCVYDGAAKKVTVKVEPPFVNPELTVPEAAYTGDRVSAGTFTASLTVGGETATLDVTIAKADSSVSTLPAAKTLTYTGSAQALIAAGEAAGGTMVYSLDGVSFSEAIPTGTNAGEYTVYYKAMGDKNHNDTPVNTVVVSIAKAAPVIPTGLTAIYSQTLDDVELPAGWEWIERTAPVGEAGERGHLANYAGDANHEDAQDVVVMVSVGQSATAMSAASDKPAYIYGEYVVVTVTPAATGVSAYGLRARFAAPAAGTVSLWNGETQITEGKPAANGQEVTFDLSTVADCLTPGSYTLKAKYTESDNMAEQTAEVSFTVAYAETEKEAEESGEQLENGIYAESPTLTAPEGTQISLSNGQDAQWSDELLLPTRDGTHTYTYYVKLENGTIAEKTVTLTADTMPPEVAEPTVLVDPTSAVITVTATDAGSGVMDIRLKVNSGEGDLVIEGNGDGSYTITGLIPGETYDLTLIARDWAGHTTSVSFSLTAPQFPTIPQTGDESRAALWLAMLAFAGAGMLLLRRRAHN